MSMANLSGASARMHVSGLQLARSSQCTRRPRRAGPLRRHAEASAVKARKRPARQGEALQTRTGTCQYIEVQPDGSDAWRLGAVADMVNEGQVRPRAGPSSSAWRLLTRSHVPSLCLRTHSSCAVLRVMCSLLCHERMHSCPRPLHRPLCGGHQRCHVLQFVRR